MSKNKVKNWRVLTDAGSDRKDPAALRAKRFVISLRSGRMD